MIKLDGVATALLSPSPEVDDAAVRRLEPLIEHQLREGIQGLAVCAAAGEFVLLSPEERKLLVESVVGLVNRRVSVLAGVLTPGTKQAAIEATAAEAGGADGVLVLTPFFVAPSHEGVFRHFAEVRSATSLPIIIYNNPGRTGINIDEHLLDEIADLDGVIAIKECDRDLGRVARKLDRCGDRLRFLSGDDDLLLPFLAIGGSGAIMSGSNLMPGICVRVVDAFSAGDIVAARNAFGDLLKVARLYRGPNHPGPLKALVSLAGFGVGPGRPPVDSLSDVDMDAAARTLEEVGLLAEKR